VITVLESSRNYRNSMRRMLVSSGGRGLLPGRGGARAVYSRGRSGGVAILVDKRRPICMVGEGTNRAVGPALALTRR